MDPVTAAFDAVPRADFLPRLARFRSGLDAPISIGHGQTNSQPRTVEAMLRLLEVRPGHRVLEVGAGSGWVTALLAHLTGATGSVVGVELVPQLSAWGARNLGRRDQPWATIRPAVPSVLGHPEGAPYDRILVSAEAATLPEELLDQLGDGGRIVVPVAGTMTLGVRRGDTVETSDHGRYRFVPLL